MILTCEGNALYFLLSLILSCKMEEGERSEKTQIEFPNSASTAFELERERANQTNWLYMSAGWEKS